MGSVICRLLRCVFALKEAVRPVARPPQYSSAAADGDLYGKPFRSEDMGDFRSRR